MYYHMQVVVELAVLKVPASVSRSVERLAVVGDAVGFAAQTVVEVDNLAPRGALEADSLALVQIVVLGLHRVVVPEADTSGVKVVAVGLGTVGGIEAETWKSRAVLRSRDAP
jgi:hypothetical protein